MASKLLLFAVLVLQVTSDSDWSSSMPRAKLSTHLVRYVPRANSTNVCTSPACIDFANSIMSNLAPNYTAVDPCQNFDQYVCAGWNQNHYYRPEQSSVSGLSIMSDTSHKVLRDIVEGLYEDKAGLSSAKQLLRKENHEKMKRAYSACMDQDKIKQAGAAALRVQLEELEEHYPAAASHTLNSTNDELTSAIIWLNKNSVPALISASPGVDNKNPDTYIITLGIGKVGLPSREYYSNSRVLVNYTRTISQMLEVMAVSSNSKTLQHSIDMVKEIVGLETKLIKVSAEPSQARDIAYSYNLITPSAVDALVPQISITNLLKAQVPHDYEIRKVIMRDPQYYGNLSSILASTPREVLHAYFQWQIINVWGKRLHNDISKPLRVLSNQLAGLDDDSEAERWRTCIDEIDANLGWILSGFYVDRAFGQESKEYGDRIIRDIKAVFAENLKALGWMSDAVKERAAKKVVNIIQQVGYPTASPAVQDPSDVNKYYEKLLVSNSSYFDNGRSYSRFQYKKNWDDLLKPVDRSRWSMTSPTVNANFNPVYNRISFPAGILQPPCFSLALPEYVSYGAFGSVAGHELTHGFDNSGSKYDETGSFVDWWDNSTLSNFRSRAQCFIDQYSKYTIPGVDGEPVHINGKLTQGENIADAGGLASSFAAWQKREKENPGQLLPGLERYSKAQMFYISYGNWQCGKIRAAQAVKNVYTDPHTPVGTRQIGALANSRGFREAFDCPIKQPTCELW